MCDRFKRKKGQTTIHKNELLLIQYFILMKQGKSNDDDNRILFPK